MLANGKTTEVLHLFCRSSRLQLLRMVHSRFFEPNCAFIDGKWTPAHSGATFEVTNPANGQVLATVADCDVTDTETAVCAARKAFKKWGMEMTARERSAILYKWYELLVKHKDELARLLTEEQVRFFNLLNNKKFF